MTGPEAAGPCVVLLTDFGRVDGYAGALSGVLATRCPAARILDLTHDVPPQNLRFAAFQLLAHRASFPAGALFLAVVDPGVGTDRPILYAEAGGRRYIGPDNGVLSWALAADGAPVVRRIRTGAVAAGAVSRTFHGRDIMAPAAARLLNGERPEALADATNGFVTIPFPSVEKMGTQWSGEILAEDRFGNLITNFPTADVEPLAERSKLWIEGASAPLPVRGLSRSYADVEPGKALAIGGSAGFLELAVRNGHAGRLLNLAAGNKIVLRFRT